MEYAFFNIFYRIELHLQIKLHYFFTVFVPWSCVVTFLYIPARSRYCPGSHQ